MSKNMFAALASDSEDEKEAPKVETKQKTAKAAKAPSNKNNQRNLAKGDFDDAPVGHKDSRDRGSKRGRGARGRGRYDGEKGPYEGGRNYGSDRGHGGRGRGGRGQRGERGRGRGRFDRGTRGRGHRGRYQAEDGVYSRLATRDQVVKDEEQKATDGGHEEHAEEFGKHMGYDKRSGTGHGREVKKGGAGKGNWGAETVDRELEHRGADDAAEIADGTPEEATEATKHAAPQVEEEAEGEAEDENENKLSYAEYLEQRKQANATLTKTEARAPEEIKMKNIEKHTEGKKGGKVVGSSIKSHEAYAPTGIKADVELGFGTAPEPEVEEGYYDRPRGRGRGARGRGRGGFNDRGRGAQGPRRGRGNKFVAKDNDFPSL